MEKEVVGSEVVDNEIIENLGMKPKQVFSRIGWALFTMAVTVIVVQSLLAGAIIASSPRFAEGPWFTWTLVGVSFYGIGFPLFVLMTKGIPNGPKGEKKEISPKDIFVMFIICMGVVYIFNIVGNFVNILIGFMKGSPVANPLVGALDGASIFATFVFVGILSPIIEEVIFRGIMLDKLRAYGDKTAIWVTALTFALFHGNLSQFFYALVLGLFWGYIAMKTNTVKHTINLHIVINVLGSVVMPYLALSENQLFVSMAGLTVIVMIVVGAVLYKMNIHKVQLDPGIIELNPATRKRTIYLNIGMVLYFLICFEMFITAILA